MFNNSILDVAIGLSFCFGAVAFLSSSVVEALTHLSKLRANTLLQGVKQILNDPNFTGLANQLYNHGLVNALGDGKANTESQLTHLPSYIDPAHFAQALVSIAQTATQTAPGTAGTTTGRAEIDALLSNLDHTIPDPQLNQVLRHLASSAKDLQDFQTHVAGWFDASVQRIGGEFKKRYQIYVFIAAFLIALVFNVDSVRLFDVLWHHSENIQALAVPTKDNLNLNNMIADLQKLPIGWNGCFLSLNLLQLSGWTSILGWFITAFASLFGSSFWFGQMQNLVKLKDSAKPAVVNKT